MKIIGNNKLAKYKAVVTTFAIFTMFGSGCGDDSDLFITENDTVVLNGDTSMLSENTTDDSLIGGYVHGNDGYFSLIDEGIKTEVKKQQGGTCWACCAATVMESNWKMQTGEDITIEPLSIVDECYVSDRREEGLFLASDSTRQAVGGFGLEVAFILSNGFGNYYLSEAPCLGATDYLQVINEYSNTNQINENWYDYDKEKVQYYLKENGAVSAIITHKTGSSNNNCNALNAPGEYSLNHAVAVVGYDDNFPKDYFNIPADQNGAWLVQNSLGTEFGDEGYYWVSYDTPILFSYGYALSNDYEKILSYSNWCFESINLGESTTVANHYKEVGSLKGVGTYIAENNMKIRVDILDNDFKTVLYTTEKEFENSGYHTIYLDKPINVDDYIVSVTYYGDAPIEGNAIDEFKIGGIRYRYTVDCNEDESYVLVDGTWLDMSKEGTMDIIGYEGSTNNCCIKAIY